MPASLFAARELIRAGVRDEAYFDEMAGYVQQAIAADPPGHIGLAGPDGKERLDKGYDPAFEAWCATRSLEPEPCIQQMTACGVGLELLLGLRDPRAVAVLRDALGVSSAALVAVAATGLAQLNDVASIPLAGVY